MKAKELANLLYKDPDMEVMILDGFNGGGEPRKINFGPTYYHVTKANADMGSDCEDMEYTDVLVIGYGSY